jgi:sulfate permease, SulP family
MKAVPMPTLVRGYERTWLRGDVLAGITVTAYLIPQVMAYAEVAGVPPEATLWAAVGGLTVYVFVGSSRQLSVGPESTTALMTATALGSLVAVGDDRVPLAAALALMVGLCCLVGWILRLGALADLLSRPVLVGYLAGIAFTMAASQLGKLLGIDVSVDAFFPIFEEVVSELGDANGATVLLSAGLIALAVAVKRFLPAVPPSLVVLGTGLVVAALADLEAHDVAVLGEVEGGLPPLAVPNVGAGDYVDLLLPATAFSLVAFADLTATVRTFAQKHGYKVDANSELRAIGAANLVGGLTTAFPASSSNSRTAVNDSTGAKTQAAVVVASAVVGIFLLVAMPLIEPLPKAALGVIIVVAAAGLINVGSMWRLRHVRPAETALALVALGGVLVFGVVGGVAVAIALSMGVFLYRAARPHDAVLGRVQDVDGYHDIERWEGAEVVPGLLVYRFDAPLFFVNAEYLHTRVLALADAARELSWIVLNAEAWMYLDATAIDVLRQLHSELQERGIVLCFARLKGRQREIFEETGLTAAIGADRFFPTVRAAVAAFEAE